MEWIDHTFLSPEENLAAEEILLEWGETGKCGEILRFWSFPRPFVVVGLSNKIATEVNEPTCVADGVPILRRCTGGGTVLQGPGCLNYTLVLRADRPGMENVTATNRTIMERTGRAVSSLLPEPCQVRGHTDLVLGTRKFSGNAQRRKKSFILFHGTFLLGFDLRRIERYLALPAIQPDYRSGRGHLDFVMNLGLGAEAVQEALKKEWQASRAAKLDWDHEVGRLVEEKYARPEWNLKF